MTTEYGDWVEYYYVDWETTREAKCQVVRQNTSWSVVVSFQSDGGEVRKIQFSTNEFRAMLKSYRTFEPD